MSQQFNDIFSDKNGSQLKGLAEKYPWCSVAQLSLLQYYKKNNSTQFEEQAAKTALFFNNTNWLNWQLHLLSQEKTDSAHFKNEPKETIQDNSPEILKQSLSNIEAEANTSETEITFEPLHTTDYFASQGIKLTDEPVTTDKLGTQLKSFTEWLKSMKKINTDALPAGNEQSEKNIQAIAEHSNVGSDIVTEAMAEVLVKQGKTDKAIELYRKLSLINPSKSAYFAAKINGLQTAGN